MSKDCHSFRMKWLLKWLIFLNGHDPVFILMLFFSLVVLPFPFALLCLKSLTIQSDCFLLLLLIASAPNFASKCWERAQCSQAAVECPSNPLLRTAAHSSA